MTPTHAKENIYMKRAKRISVCLYQKQQEILLQKKVPYCKGKYLHEESKEEIVFIDIRISVRLYQK